MRFVIDVDCDADNAEPVESLPITWDDPTSRIEREKLAAKLSKDSQSVSPYRGHGFEEEHIEVSEINFSFFIIFGEIQ